MFLLVNFAVFFVILPLWLSFEARKLLLRCNGRRSLIATIAILYLLLIVLLPPFYLGWLGTHAELTRPLASKDLMLLAVMTIFVRGYEISYFQHLQIIGAAWTGQLTDRQFPERSLWKR